VNGRLPAAILDHRRTGVGRAEPVASAATANESSRPTPAYRHRLLSSIKMEMAPKAINFPLTGGADAGRSLVNHWLWMT